MTKRLIITSLLGLAGIALSAQNGAWSLDRCIEYAQSHNINLQQMQLQQQTQQISLNTAKHGMDPFVSLSIIGGGYLYPSTKNNSQSISQTTFTAQKPLFDGFATHYNKKMNEWSLASIVAQSEQAAKDITITVATYYLQILYLQGRIDICKKQVEVGNELYHQISQFVRTGRLAESRLTEIEALQASYEYALTSTQGSYDAALLSLQHLLNLPADSAFAVLPIQGDQPEALPMSSRDYYDLAIGVYPQLRASEAAIEMNKAMVKYYRSQMIPSLSIGLQASTFNSNYFNNLDNKLVLGHTTDQWEKNLYFLPFLQLNVPIYSKRQVVNSIKSAKLNISASELTRQNNMQALREIIEQNWMLANNAIRQYEAAVKSEESSRKNYDNMQKSYVAGRADFYSLSQSRQLWVDAQDRALQAHYEYLIRRRILEYYVSNTF